MSNQETSNAVQRLMDALDRAMRQGSPDLASEDVLCLLREVWDTLKCSWDAGMTSCKLVSGRVEAMKWEPPSLSFRIERHGGTVNGSSRAEIHAWTVDLMQMTAKCGIAGYRQLIPRRRPLNVQPIVVHVVDLVRCGAGDDCLKWSEDHERVTVRVGKLVPDDASKETVQGRRRRFAEALRKAMDVERWCTVSGTTPHTFERVR